MSDYILFEHIINKANLQTGTVDDTTIVMQFTSDTKDRTPLQIQLSLEAARHLWNRLGGELRLADRFAVADTYAEKHPETPNSD